MAAASRGLVWDNLNAHLSKAVRELVAARDRLTVFRLPPCAPDLNPVGQADSMPATTSTAAAPATLI